MRDSTLGSALKRIISIACLSLTISACQTTTSAPPADLSPATGATTAQEPTSALQSNVKFGKGESDGELPVKEAAPRNPRFCSDDIYSQHLEQNYLRQNPKVKTDARSERARKQSAAQESFETLRYQLPLEFAGLPVQASPRVLSWIHYFTGNGRADFLLWLVRSGSYRETLVPLLKAEGLPPEFFFLAMIESGFSNEAFSRASAVGTWQFMKPTAKHYGLSVDHWVDERRDPVKSTLAAARYLKDLHRQFGDWFLALAAYNAGPSRVIRAMSQAKSRNYWVISKTSALRPETKNYVPKLLAALIIASHPENFGFQVTADLRNQTPSSSIPLTQSYRLEEIAQKLGVTLADIKRWNPELQQGITPPINTRRSTYALRLPKALQIDFQSQEAEFERLVIDDVLMHKIRRGETIARIARQYNVSVQKILHTNPNLKPQRLKPGENIAVPVPSIKGTRQATPM